MANITITGNFFNAALTPAVAVLIYQAGIRIQDNPPGVVVNANPYVASDDFVDNVILPAGNYDMVIRGATDGEFVLSIAGAGVALDHPCPPNYQQDITDAFVLTIT